MTNKALLLLTGLLLAARVLASNDDALEWFQRMHHAMHTVNYQGRFVYQVGERLEPMFIAHRVQDGQEIEQLVALNGGLRQVVSQDGTVTFEPGPHVVKVVDGSTPGLPAETDTASLLAHYDLRLGGVHRIADRPTRVLDVIPKDHLRYGYRLYLDQATGLPLCSIMLGPDGKQLSRLLFVELRTSSAAASDAAVAKSSPSAGSVQVLARAPHHSLPWKLNDLPPGYSLVSYHLDASHQRQHMVFSDGVSVLSLYVEPEPTDPLDGYSQVGATGIYAEPRMGHQFTAMGEAPADALRMIVHAVDAQ